MYKEQIEINLNFILERVSEEEIYKAWLGIEPQLNTPFTNPLRDDKKADCYFYISPRTGRLKFHDIAWSWNVDCFNIVQFVECCSFKQALYKIAYHFKLIEGNSPAIKQPIKSILTEKEKFKYKVKRGEWDNKNIKFWKDNGVLLRSTLDLFRISPLSILFLEKNDKLDVIWSGGEPAYVYYFPESNVKPDYKSYFPNRNKVRFLQQPGSNYIQGWEQLPKEGEFVLITKAYKDVACLYECNIPSIAPHSEAVIITEDKIKELKSRFKYIGTLFDNDMRGKRSTVIYNKLYNTIPLLFPYDFPKDFTDTHKKYGRQYMLDVIETIKAQYL